MKGRLENTFEDAGRQIGDVDLKGALREINRLVDDIDDPDVQGWLGSIANKVPANMKGRVADEELQHYRRMADNQWRSQSGAPRQGRGARRPGRHRRAAHAAPGAAPGGRRLEDAGERWRLLRTVERGKTITSDGELSPVGLDSALRGGYKNEYRYGGTTGNPDIETLSRAAKVAYAHARHRRQLGHRDALAEPAQAHDHGQVERAYAKSYLEGLDLKDYVKAGVAGGGGIRWPELTPSAGLR